MYYLEMEKSLQKFLISCIIAGLLASGQVDNGRRGMLPFYRHILVKATDFSRFQGILWNLQAITRSHIRLDEI
jgi:hypothetical protein